MASTKKTILIAGSLAKGALEHQYTRGLKNIGLNVQTIDIQEPLFRYKAKSLVNKLFSKAFPKVFLYEFNKQFFQYVKEICPDIVLIFKGMELFPETIEKIRTYTKLLVNYNPDHPFKFFSPGSGNSYIRHSLPFYDLHISYSKSIVSRLHKEFQLNAECVPFGYDETVVPRVSELGLEDEFIFIGAWDKQRAKAFNKLSSSISIYGPGEWKTRTNNLKNVKEFYKHQALYDSEYINASHSAAGCINLLRKQNLIEGSHNMRTFEVCGYGGLLISQRTEEQQSFFEEDKEAIYFDSIEELDEKLKFLKSQPQLIKQIKKNAMDRSQSSGYSYFERSKRLADILLQHL